LEESKRDKYIRFILISLCLLVVIIGFVYSGSPREIERKRDAHVSAQVLKKQAGGEDAVIVVSRMDDDQTVLVIYKIEKDNGYHFKVLHSLEMKEYIEEIKVQSDGAGLWAKVKKDQWFLFSNRLEVLDQTEHPGSAHSTRQTFHYDENTQRASLKEKPDKIEIKLPKETEPLEIHPLSDDDSLWLVVIEDDLILAKSR
jgi:hypothetical protein